MKGTGKRKRKTLGGICDTQMSHLKLTLPSDIITKSALQSGEGVRVEVKRFFLKDKEKCNVSCIIYIKTPLGHPVVTLSIREKKIQYKGVGGK